MFKDNKVFTSFSSNDIAGAKKFYSEVLGFSTADRMGGLELELSGGNQAFIYPKPDHAPATYTVLNIIVEDIGKSAYDLSSKGIKFEHYDNEYMKTDEKGIARMENGPSMAWFKDPAGNILSIIQTS
ncbi:MAG TPA: VOC family protein [Patescibacteria group bacterium]|nr:VOC family protein [Patescibacteria group bacterium]